ncbi:MAG: T9SS type A sorting domain-containing protein [Flavobacteriales bacterium]|nr:T9SS type A sorting domain-containing protein [Flavobacteriales bacterium]
MNRITTSLLFVALMSSLSVAQITITKQHMPASGDTIRYSQTTGVTLSPGQGGANKSWDFTDLSPISQGVEEYINSTFTPYLLNFGFTAIGQKIADTLGFGPASMTNVFRFYRSTNASFSDVGIGFQFGPLPLPQAGKHTDPDEIYLFPLQYADMDTTTFDVAVPIKAGPIQVGTFFRTGTRYTEVDGWGTISTPYASNVSCLRVKSTIESFDSVAVTTLSLNFGTETKQVEYKWLATSERIPLLTISGNEVNGNLVVTDVRYRDNYREIGPIQTIIADFTADKTTAMPGEVITLTNQSDGVGLSYNWVITPASSVKFVNGTSATAESPKIVITDTGYFSVKLLATVGNAKDSAVKQNYLHITNSTGLQDVTSLDYIVYPNPTNGLLVLNPELHQDVVRIELYATGGQLIRTLTAPFNGLINISDLPDGTYHLHIFDSNQGIHRFPIVKR